MKLSEINRKIFRTKGIIYGANLSVAALATIFFMVMLLPASKVYPWSDEWGYLAPSAGSHLSLRWLFEQHGDHRIPIQKIVHEIALKATSFDFRSLVAINMVIALIISLMMIVSNKIYRNYSTVGDLIFPLCALSFGAGYLQWGFEFQFLSTVFFSVAFIFFSVLYEKNQKIGYALLSLAAIAMCALCGLNGMVVSSLVVATLLLFVVLRLVRISWLITVLAVLVLIENAVLWITWQPAEASTAQTSFQSIQSFILGMINSPWVVYSFTHPEWKLFVLSALEISGGVAAVVNAIREKSFSSYSILASFIAGAGLIIAVAYGRSKDTAWHPGLEMHYGSLALLILFTSWTAFSKHFSRKLVGVSGLVIAVLFGFAFRANYQWRLISMAERAPSEHAAARAIFSNQDAEVVASKHINTLYYVDTAQTREMVKEGIRLLRIHSRSWQK